MGTVGLQTQIRRMEIFRYKPEHEDAVISAIKEDHSWDIFTNERAIDHYKKSLGESITYVCYENGTFGGYLRALLDDGIAIYISELFVEFRHLAVYALSDEDAYYEKLGYRRMGSVYEIHE